MNQKEGLPNDRTALDRYFLFLGFIPLILFFALMGCGQRSGQVNIPRKPVGLCASAATIQLSNSSPKINVNEEIELTATLSCYNGGSASPELMASVDEEAKSYLALVDASGKSHSSMASLTSAGSGNTYTVSFRFLAIKSTNSNPKVNFTLSGDSNIRTDVIFEILSESTLLPSELTVEPFQESKNGQVSVDCGQGPVLRWKASGEGEEVIPAFQISLSKYDSAKNTSEGNSAIETIDVHRSEVEVESGSGRFSYSFGKDEVALLDNGNLLSYEFVVRACKEFQKNCNESESTYIDARDVFDPFHQCESHKRGVTIDFANSVQGRILMKSSDSDEKGEFGPHESRETAYFNLGDKIDLSVIPFVGSTISAIQIKEDGVSLLEKLSCKKQNNSIFNCKNPLELEKDLALTVRGDRKSPKGKYAVGSLAISKIEAQSAFVSATLDAKKEIDLLEYKFYYWRRGESNTLSTGKRRIKKIAKGENRALTNTLPKLKEDSQYYVYVSVRIDNKKWVSSEIVDFTTPKKIR